MQSCISFCSIIVRPESVLYIHTRKTHAIYVYIYRAARFFAVYLSNVSKDMITKKFFFFYTNETASDAHFFLYIY